MRRDGRLQHSEPDQHAGKPHCFSGVHCKQTSTRVPGYVTPHPSMCLDQEYQRRFNLEPLVKPVSKEEEFVEQQHRTRATVRPS